MLFRDLTINFHEFRGYPGTLWDLRDELSALYGSTVNAWEDKIDGTLSEVTFCDFNRLGPTNSLINFCNRYGVDLKKAWEDQTFFDHLCFEANYKK